MLRKRIFSRVHFLPTPSMNADSNWCKRACPFGWVLLLPAELVRKNRLWKGHLRAHVQQKRPGALHWVWQGRFGWKLSGIEGALNAFERKTCNGPFLCFLPRPFWNEFFGLRLLNIAQAGMRFFLYMRRFPCHRRGSSAVLQAFAVPGLAPHVCRTHCF